MVNIPLHPKEVINVSKKNLKTSSMIKAGLHVKQTKMANMIEYALANLLITMIGLSWLKKALYSSIVECMKVIQDHIPNGEQTTNFGTV